MHGLQGKLALARGELGGYGGQADATAASEATTLPFALATPHTVVDVLVEGVVQALFCHGARCTDSLGLNHSHPIRGKEE